MKIDKLLTELEKDKLRLIAGDSIMMGAIKKVVLASVYFDGTIQKGEIDPDSQKNFLLALASEPKITDEELALKVRASLAGVQLLEMGFKSLETFAFIVPRSKETKNTSR